MKILATAGRLLLTQMFVAQALAEGHEVVLLTSQGDPLRESDISRDSDALTIFDINLLDTENLKQVLLLFAPDMIFHFDVHLFESSHISAEDYWEKNEEGTRSLLWAMTQAGSHSLIMASSSSVYGALPEPYLSETHTPNPTSDCGESLLSAEEMALTFQSSIPHAKLGILRLFEAIGHAPKTEAVEGLLSRYINKWQIGEEWEIADGDLNTRDGSAVRDFVDVEDLAMVFLEAAIKLIREDLFVSNVGNGLGITIRELNEICNSFSSTHQAGASGSKMNNSGFVGIKVNPSLPHESPRLVADTRFFKSWYPHPLKNIRQILGFDHNRLGSV